MAHFTTRRASQQRFFRKSDCDCQGCIEQERRIARWIGVGFVLIAALFFGGWAIVMRTLG